MKMTPKQKPNIKRVVDNKKWQALRRKLKGTWNNESNVNNNLQALRNYLGNTTDWYKLRRVQNYLAALRGIDDTYPQIVTLRGQVNKRLEALQ